MSTDVDEAATETLNSDLDQNAFKCSRLECENISKHDAAVAGEDKKASKKRVTSRSSYRAASANVCTLGPAEIDKENKNLKTGGLLYTGRAAVLEECFDSNGFDFVGVQEARIRKNQTRRGRHYTMYASSANERGQYGVQLWVKHWLAKLVSAVYAPFLVV